MCPSPEDISPCSCHETNYNLHAHCSWISSLETLQKCVRGMRGYTFKTFTIENSNFSFIPNNLFEKLNINHLSIIQSNFSRISNLGEPQFHGLENSLLSLTFKDTYTEKNPLAYVSIGHLKLLQTLYVSRSHAGLISNHWFKDGPVSLRTVRFVQAHIENVGYKALQALTKLQVVDISDNKIKYVTRTMLPNPAEYLEEINLERNKLESFEENFFSGMPQLKRVLLELNEFSTISEAIWKPVWSHLQFLNMDYNPLICDKEIKWMYDYAERLEHMLAATCYKPFNLMDRDLHDLKVGELK